MSVKRFLIPALFGLLLSSPALAENTPVEEEVVFTQVTKVSKSNENCMNGGNLYTFTVTGLVNGAEKTITIPWVDPNAEGTYGKGESKTVDFCEKAALLTKAQPDKHDLYMRVKYLLDNSVGGGPPDGLCPGAGVQQRLRGTHITCELR